MDLFAAYLERPSPAQWKGRAAAAARSSASPGDRRCALCCWRRSSASTWRATGAAPPFGGGGAPPCPRQRGEKRAGEEKKKKAPAQVAPEPFGLEQAMGIEPTTSAWEADVLPLNYACTCKCSTIIVRLGPKRQAPGEKLQKNSPFSPLRQGGGNFSKRALCTGGKGGILRGEGGGAR